MLFKLISSVFSLKKKLKFKNMYEMLEISLKISFKRIGLKLSTNGTIPFNVFLTLDFVYFQKDTINGYMALPLYGSLSLYIYYEIYGSTNDGFLKTVLIFHVHVPGT